MKTRKPQSYKGRMLNCERCPHVWVSRKYERPVRCPRCSSVKWDEPRKEQAA